MSKKKTGRKAFDKHVYRYTATVIRAVDGDTLEVDFDYGFGMIDQGKTLRLSGIQTPELKSKIPAEQAAAKAAMINLGKICPPGSTILIHTLYDKREKCGRFFGWVYRTPEDFADSIAGKVTVDGVPTLSVNRMQVLAGHAIAWDGTYPAKPETVLRLDLGGVR